MKKVFPQVKYKSNCKVYTVVFIYHPTGTTVYKGDFEMIDAALNSNSVLVHGSVTDFYEGSTRTLKLPTYWRLFGNNPRNFILKKIYNWQFQHYSGKKPTNPNQNYWVLTLDDKEVIAIWRKLPRKYLDITYRGTKPIKSRKLKWIHNTTLTSVEKDEKPVENFVEEVDLTENDTSLVVTAIEQMIPNLGDSQKIKEYQNILRKLT